MVDDQVYSFLVRTPMDLPIWSLTNDGCFVKQSRKGVN